MLRYEPGILYVRRLPYSCVFLTFTVCCKKSFWNLVPSLRRPAARWRKKMYALAQKILYASEHN